jgi:serine/threonine-protein kinase
VSSTSLFQTLQSALGDAYVVERELGGGGMSRVFLAHESALNRKVVIKVLAPELTNDVMLARFKREFEVTAVLQHPHILPVLTTGTRNGLLYYIAPFVEGESLRHRLQREGKLPVDDAVRILSELAGALDYAHERNVVHRDIKPENVLLSDGHAVLADFGIAAALSGPVPSAEARAEGRLTEVGMAMGTPGYMSPEQAAGERDLDGRSDLYSLAIVGYEMFTGEPPFTGTSPLTVLTQHLTALPKPVDSRRADTPPAVAIALMKALAKKPEDRFQTAGEFRRALGVSYSGGSRALNRTQRRAAWGAVGALVVSLLVVLLALSKRGEATDVDDNLVVITPFDVLDSAHTVWREGLVDLLAANLDGAGPLRTVSPAVVVKRFRGRADDASSGRFARSLGARLAVYGRVLRAGEDSVRVDARVVDAVTGSSLGDIRVSDRSERMDRLSDSLTVAILRQLNETRAIGAVRQATIGSTSLPAIKAYLQGAQFYRHSDWDSASTYFDRAIALDSNFAPARRQLMNALSWKLGAQMDLRPEGYQHALLAGQRNRGLAPRESVLVAADSIFSAMQLNVIARNGPQAQYPLAKRLFALLESAANRFPQDPEIWFKLGDARYHWGFLQSSSQTRIGARQAFARSIEFDSAFGPAYIHQAEIVASQQDREELRRVIRAYLDLHPSDVHASSFRIVDQLLDPARRDDVLRGLGDSTTTTSAQALLTAYSTVAPILDSAETQVAMARAMVNGVEAGRMPKAFSANARNALVAMLALRGHLRDAVKEAEPTQYGILMDAATLGAIPPDSATALFDRWLRSPSTPVQSAVTLRWWLARGDTARTQAAFRTTLPNGQPFYPEYTRAPLMALARGDTGAAIRGLTVPDSICLQNCAGLRSTLGPLLEAWGQDDRAAAAVLDQDYNGSPAMRVMWMLHRGRVNERLKQNAKAIDSYLFVVDAWRFGDAEVQGYVREAREGIERLRSDAPRTRSQVTPGTSTPRS